MKIKMGTAGQFLRGTMWLEDELDDVAEQVKKENQRHLRRLQRLDDQRAAIQKRIAQEAIDARNDSEAGSWG